MSLNVMLTLEEIVDQINKYKIQLDNTVNAVQQIKGAIAACEHQMQLLVNKQNEHVLKQAEGAKQNAIEEREQQENNLSEHQDGDCSGEATEASSGDSIE